MKGTAKSLEACKNPGKLLGKINREDYLKYSLKFKPEEIKLQRELMHWLPKEIIDCHAHCNLPEHVLSIRKKDFNHMLSSFPSFTLEESYKLHRIFFPGKKIRSLRFPGVFFGIDHKKANEYLLKNSRKEDRVALYGLPNDIKYTIRMLRHPRVSALKMYPSYLNLPATKIYDYFHPKILKITQKLKIPIILHLPRIITESVDDLVRVVTDFPKIKIVIAHLGLSKKLIPGLVEAYKKISQYNTIYMDTSMNPSGEVIKAAINSFGFKRIMYGSDEPIYLLRHSVYNNPVLGQRLITEYPYHWVNPEENRKYNDMVGGQIHSMWKSLNALKSAIDSLPQKLRLKAKKSIFHRNASEFFGF